MMLPLRLQNTSQSILPAARLSPPPSLSVSRVSPSSFSPSPRPHARLALPPSLDYPPLYISLPPFGLLSSPLSSIPPSPPPPLPPSLPPPSLSVFAALQPFLSRSPTVGKQLIMGGSGGVGRRAVDPVGRVKAALSSAEGEEIEGYSLVWL